MLKAKDMCASFLLLFKNNWVHELTEKKYLARGFRDFRPWLLGPIAFSSMFWEGNIPSQEKPMVEELLTSCEAKREEETKVP